MSLMLVSRAVMVFWVVCCVWHSITGKAHAQLGAALPDGQEEQRLMRAWQKKDATALLLEYEQQHMADSVRGKIILDQVRDRGLEPTLANVAWVQELLNHAQASGEEKEVLVHILGAMHARTSEATLKTILEQNVRSNLQNPQGAVARSAILIYARLGYFPDSIDAVLSAQKRQLITENTAFGDLASLLHFADDMGQLRILRLIGQTNNPVAVQSLIADWAHQGVHQGERVVLKPLHLGPAKVMLKILENNEPVFPKDTPIQAVVCKKYVDWLKATANLWQVLHGTDKESFIEKRLMAADTDPRKVMAYAGTAFRISPAFEAHLQRVLQACTHTPTPHPCG